MNYNLISYALYLPITFCITFLVGRALHRAGKYFVCEMIRDNEVFAQAVNNSLLVGYYLVNLGYVTIMISNWEAVHSLTSLLMVLCDKLGTILLTLGIIHFINMLVLQLSAKNADNTFMFHSN